MRRIHILIFWLSGPCFPPAPSYLCVALCQKEDCSYLYTQLQRPPSPYWYYLLCWERLCMALVPSTWGCDLVHREWIKLQRQCIWLRFICVFSFSSWYKLWPKSYFREFYSLAAWMECRLCYLILVTHHSLGPIDTAASVGDNKYLGQRFLKNLCSWVECSIKMTRYFQGINKAPIPFTSFLPSWLHTHNLTPVVSLLGCPASSKPLLRLCTYCYPTSTSYST